MKKDWLVGIKMVKCQCELCTGNPVKATIPKRETKRVA
jgi:hypothetical protein